MILFWDNRVINIQRIGNYSAERRDHHAMLGISKGIGDIVIAN